MYWGQSEQQLQPEVLPLLQATPHAIFQHDNARPYVARIVLAFFQRRHVRHTCCSSDMSGIWLVGNLFVRVLQHLLLTLCGLAYKLRGGTFPRKISRVSLIPCHDAERLWLQHMEASHHIKITCSQTMYSSVIVIVCLLPSTKSVVYISFLSFVSFLMLQFSQTLVYIKCTIIILLVVLYGCETWSLTLRENKTKILRLRKKNREWRNLHNTQIYALYSSHIVYLGLRARQHLRLLAPVMKWWWMIMMAKWYSGTLWA